MPYDSAPALRPARPWYATDSGRAGVVLSVVTVLVLAVGVAVIHGTMPQDATEHTPLPSGSVGPVVESPTAKAAGDEPIVIYGSTTSPTLLPAPPAEADDATDAMPPSTAGRDDQGALNRR